MLVSDEWLVTIAWPSDRIASWWVLFYLYHCRYRYLYHSTRTGIRLCLFVCLCHHCVNRVNFLGPFKLPLTFWCSLETWYYPWTAPWSRSLLQRRIGRGLPLLLTAWLEDDLLPLGLLPYLGLPICLCYKTLFQRTSKLRGKARSFSS